MSVNTRLYVYITSNYSVETQIGESLAENVEIHNEECSFNIRLENMEEDSIRWFGIPFINSIRMTFGLTNW